jgi:hypothetical protein
MKKILTVVSLLSFLILAAACTTETTTNHSDWRLRQSGISQERCRDGRFPI